MVTAFSVFKLAVDLPCRTTRIGRTLRWTSGHDTIRERAGFQAA
jgi:hypothetical protein